MVTSNCKRSGECKMKGKGMMDKLFDLTGKIALITGGSRGLGREMAIAFAERGADIVVASRKIESCEEVAQEVRALGRRALPVAVNMSDWHQVDQLVETVYAEWGRVDILVNNAGMSPLVPSHEVSEELYDKVVGLNFKGPFHLAAVLAKKMSDGDGGVIINVSSAGSYKPVPGVIPYSSAKAAMNTMTVGLAKEYAPKVRVNTIVPGPFLTDIAKAWPEEQRKTAANDLGRPGRPEEILTAALYLASPCSSFTTGSMVRVDGGVS